MTTVWTKETEDKTRKMWLDGLSAGQISAQLGIPRNAIMGKVYRLGLTRNPSLRPQAKPVREVNIPAPHQKEGGAPLIDVGVGQCRYGVSAHTAKQHLFCGQAVKKGSSYCPEHHDICYVIVQRD